MDEKSPSSSPSPTTTTAKPFDAATTLDTATHPITIADKEIAPAVSLNDADEALAFLSNHPLGAAAIAEQGAAILEDEAARKRLLRKIDWTITPLLAGTYFLQFLDKNTLSYTSVMGIREDAGLKGQEYSHVSMLFYIGECASFFCHYFVSCCASVRTLWSLVVSMAMTASKWGLSKQLLVNSHPLAVYPFLSGCLGVFSISS